MQRVGPSRNGPSSEAFDFVALGDSMAVMAGEKMAGISVGAIDLNDLNFDALLANDRPLGDPEVVRGDKGGRVLFRVISGSAAASCRGDLDGIRCLRMSSATTVTLRLP